MKRRSRDVLLGLLLALVVFLVAAQVTVTLVAERQDAARPTELEAPAVVQEHERLAALVSELVDFSNPKKYLTEIQFLYDVDETSPS